MCSVDIVHTRMYYVVLQRVAQHGGAHSVSGLRLSESVLRMCRARAVAPASARAQRTAPGPRTTATSTGFL